MEITARPRRRGRVRALRVALVTACAASAAMLVPAALGYSTHVVGDDAMAGGFPRGSLVLDEPLPLGRLAAGDVVTLTSPDGELVVRRVVSVDDRGVRTGGDATGADPWVVPEATTDRVVLAVPALGWPVLAVDSVSVPPWAPAGATVALAALLVGLRRSGRGHGERPPVAPPTVPEPLSVVQPTPRWGDL
jgi:signal peptidase